MIEKSKIKRGLIFWNDCEGVTQIPNSDICIKFPASLMQIEEFEKDNLVTCSVYNKESFASYAVFTVDYIEKHATEITLDDTDWQEMVDLYNTIQFEKTKEYDWSATTPDSLKERVSNFLSRDFYQKYNLKRR